MEEQLQALEVTLLTIEARFLLSLLQIEMGILEQRLIHLEVRSLAPALDKRSALSLEQLKLLQVEVELAQR